MKILRLDLRAFGPFTDVALDLSAGTEGLHVIYGPNEAGKSSALRAIRAMLYGIPNQTPDNFRHDYNRLAVGGTLRAADGRELQFLRLKRQNNPLRQADGQTPLDDAALDPFLQGVSESQFRTLFGIDHDELIQGGRTVLEGRNDLGQLLFAAGTGLVAARKVQEALQAEHEALFKPTGKLPPINRALAEYSAARQAVTRAMLPSATWDDHDRALNHAQKRQEELDRQLAEARREQRRLSRIRRAAPLLAEHRRKSEQLAALGPVPHLADDFARRWQAAETGLELARRAQVDAEAEAKEISSRRDEVILPQDILELADAIDPLRQALARYQADRQNRPARVVARDRDHDSATRRLLDLGLDPDQPPRLSRAQRDAIQALAQSLPAARQDATRSADEVDRLAAERRRLVAERETLTETGDPAALAMALDRARGAGDLDARLDVLAASIDQADRQITRDAARLGYWNGPVDTLDALPLPAVAAIDADENTLRDLESALRDVSRRADEARQHAVEAEEAIRQLQLGGEVPTEAELASRRAHRDGLWDQLRRHWLDGQPLPATAALLVDFDRAVRQADDLADRLRREADRVAQLVQHESRRAQARQQEAVLTDQLAQARSQRDVAWRAWCDRWSASGIVPDAPRVMREWLTQRVEPLRAKLAAREQDREALAAVIRQREAIRRNLADALDALRQPVPPAESSMAVLLDHAQAALSRLWEHVRMRDQLDRDLRKLDDDRSAALDRRDLARERLAALESRWNQALALLGLGADATTEQATGAVESLTEALALRENALAIDREIAEIDRATRGFVDRVTALAGRVSPPITETDPETMALTLLSRLADARERADVVESLNQGLEKALARARRQREAAAEHEVARKAMAREAGCAGPEDVPATLEAVDQARPLRDRIAGIEDQLLQEGRGITLAEIAAEVAAVPPDECDARLDQLESTINALEQERDAQQILIGAQQNELARMDGRPDAADAAAQASTIAAHLSTQVDQYIRLRLASALLRQGIERHRQRNQGPILGRAGDHFARLTRGSFTGLQVAEGPKGEPLLVGVRPGGETVRVDGLSEGSADALYLALRLAGLETHLDAHPPMPLIVDDVLIQFDDDRTMAALEALAALSRRTQVLLFTHHRHLVELAAALDPSLPVIHELPGRAP